ncbi:DUF4430 domain-containing protein [Paenibacillus terreus]|uniref:DUF4430 domain-containing protein n=1 Tax=Paenibacillus terreus TaxID=1387834 RepID=A0ABV5B3K8_9BACL
MPHGKRKQWLLPTVFVLLLSLLLLAGCTTGENKTDTSNQTETVAPEDQASAASSGGEAAKSPAGSEVAADDTAKEAVSMEDAADQTAAATDSSPASKESGEAASVSKESKADSSSQARVAKPGSGSDDNAGAGTKTDTSPERKEGASAGSAGAAGTSASATKAPAKSATGSGSSSSEGGSSASTGSAAAQKGGITEPAVTDSEPVQNTVTLSIAGDEETGTIMPATSVELQAGDTALEVLKRVTRSNGIQMEYKGAKAVAYIEGIDNLYEFDHGPKSGWMFRINGQFPSVGAGAYTLKVGDRIEWLYTLDLGADIGAKSN